MGWKMSMIIIQNPENFQDEKHILNTLGMGQHQYSCVTTLENCIYPRDESINIGYYNNCIIICDDFQLTGKFIMDQTSVEELGLAKLFPKSEILSVSCLNLTKFHGYSLVKNGRIVRAKAIDPRNIYYVNIGAPLKEEKLIYDKGELRHSKYYWIAAPQNQELTEDEMMEDFTFNVAQRLLGVRLNEMEADQLCYEIPFKKYSKYI